MTNDGEITYAHPPYTPMISLRHELGIMFGFAAACILTVAVYYVFWQGNPFFPLPKQSIPTTKLMIMICSASQRRATARDDARRKDLRERGFHHERGGYHDKALHRYASRDPVAQTQGQTLEFLTAPDQFGSGGHQSSNSNNSNSKSNKNGQPAEDAVSSSSSLRVPAMMRPAAAAGKMKYPMYEVELQTFSTESSGQSANLAVPWASKSNDLL